MLDDNAIVCPRCGASQNGGSNAEYTKTFEHSSLNNKVSDAAYVSSDVSDTKFLSLYKIAKIKGLLFLINILLMLLPLVILFAPYFNFTGVNVASETYKLTSYPHSFNLIEFLKYNDKAFDCSECAWGIGPNSILSVPSFVLVLGALVPAAIGLFGCLMAIPAKKQNAYQAYMNNPEKYKKNIKNIAAFTFTFIGMIFPLIALLILKSKMDNLSYTYSTGKYYAYGEMALNQNSFTLGLVFSIVVPLIIVATVVLLLTLVISKKVDEVA